MFTLNHFTESKSYDERVITIGYKKYVFNRQRWSMTEEAFSTLPTSAEFKSSVCCRLPWLTSDSKKRLVSYKEVALKKLCTVWELRRVYTSRLRMRFPHCVAFFYYLPWFVDILEDKKVITSKTQRNAETGCGNSALDHLPPISRSTLYPSPSPTPSNISLLSSSAW